jgi:D-amino-acid dehydrogenase
LRGLTPMSGSKSQNIAVIGAGVTGVTTAYALQDRGFNVTLFDRQPYAAMETSFANGGQLSASNAEVWNSWANVYKGVKWLFSPGAPLLVNPKPSWHKISWMAEFLGAIRHYEDNTIATTRLAIAARAHLKRMAAAEGIDFNCEDRGILHIYRSKAEFEAAVRVSVLLAKGGLERQELGPDDIRRIEPTVNGDYYGGFFTPSDFTGDIHKLTVGLADACQRRGGTLRFSTEISKMNADENGVSLSVIDRAGGAPQVETFDKVVVCAGVGSRAIARQFGDRVNVYPVKGYSITVNLTTENDQKAAPWVSLLDDKAKIVASRLGADRYRVAGTAEFNGFNRDIRMDRVQPLVDWCRQLFPDMSTRQCVPWAGLRPMMPDMLPRVAAGRNPRVLYNTGHGHLGWTLSAATAEAVADLALVGVEPSFRRAGGVSAGEANSLPDAQVALSTTAKPAEAKPAEAMAMKATPAPVKRAVAKSALAKSDLGKSELAKSDLAKSES